MRLLWVTFCVCVCFNEMNYAYVTPLEDGWSLSLCDNVSEAGLSLIF